MREHYRGLVATLAGAAKQQLVVTDEETEFYFAQNYRAWSIPAYREKYSEYEYSRSTLSAIKTAQTPLTLEGDGVAMAGHEAALVDFPSMNLRMPDSDRRMGKALSALYGDGEPEKKGRSGLGQSAPRVAKWLGDIRDFFHAPVVQVIQRDAFERKGLRQMLLEPEFLATVEADVTPPPISGSPSSVRRCTRSAHAS